jgi:hypothetical protein
MYINGEQPRMHVSAASPKYNNIQVRSMTNILKT